MSMTYDYILNVGANVDDITPDILAAIKKADGSKIRIKCEDKDIKKVLAQLSKIDAMFAEKIMLDVDGDSVTKTLTQIRNEAHKRIEEIKKELASIGDESSLNSELSKAKKQRKEQVKEDLKRGIQTYKMPDENSTNYKASAKRLLDFVETYKAAGGEIFDFDKKIRDSIESIQKNSNLNITGIVDEDYLSNKIIKDLELKVERVKELKAELAEYNPFLEGSSGTGSGTGSGSGFSINDEDLKELKGLLDSIDKAINSVAKAFGTIDDNSDVDNLLTTFSKLNKEINNLSDSLSGMNFNVVFNSSSKDPVAKNRKVGKATREAIDETKRAYQELETYLTNKAGSFGKLTRGLNGSFMNNYIDYTGKIGGSKNSLSEELFYYQKLIDLLKEAANTKGIDFSSWSNEFEKPAKEAAEIVDKVANGTDEIENTFKNLFGNANNVNIEGLSDGIGEVCSKLQKMIDLFESVFSVKLDPNTENANLEFVNLLNVLNEIKNAIKSINSIKINPKVEGKIAEGETHANNPKDANKGKGNNPKKKDSSMSEEELKKRSESISNAVDNIKDGTDGIVTSVTEFKDSQDNLVKAQVKTKETLDDAVKTTTTTINYNKKDGSSYSSDIDTYDYEAIRKQNKKESQKLEAQQKKQTNKLSEESYARELQYEKEINRLKINNIEASKKQLASNNAEIESLEERIKKERETRTTSGLNNNESQLSLNKEKLRLTEELTQAQNAYNAKLKEANNIARNDWTKKASELKTRLTDALSLYDNASDDTKKQATSLIDRLNIPNVHFDVDDSNVKQTIKDITTEVNKLVKSLKVSNQASNKDTKSFQNELYKEANNLLDKQITIRKQLRNLESGEEKSKLRAELKEIIAEYKEYLALIDEGDLHDSNKDSALKEKEDKAYREALTYGVQQRQKENEQIQKNNAAIDETVQKMKELKILGSSDAYANAFTEAEIKVESLNNELKTGEITLNKYNSEIKKIVDNLNKNKNVVSFIDKNDIEKAKNEMANYASLMSNGRAKFFSEDKDGNITYTWEEQDGVVRKLTMSYDRLDGALSAVSTRQTETAKGTKTLTQLFKQGWQNVKQYVVSFVGFYEIINAIRNGISVIRDLDTALTEMRKVSDESVKSLKKFQSASFDIAKTVGTTAKQIQNSTADFMRLGESLEEAAKSAEVANILLNVSEFESIDEATESLVSMSAAYNELDKLEIVDKLNLIGRIKPKHTVMYGDVNMS